VPERPHLYPSLNVDEALRYHSAFYPSWDGKRAEALLASFELRRSQHLGRLSKGEMGKLMVLLVLAQLPDLFLLDEPTDGLDPVVRRDVMAALLDYVSERGATVLISSHLVHELERMCDWVGVMDRGRMVAEMPMQSFKEGIKRLRFSAAPRLEGDTPFELLSRATPDLPDVAEEWVVSRWEPAMSQHLVRQGAALREVVDMDLEESFVALLSTARGSAS